MRTKWKSSNRRQRACRDLKKSLETLLSSAWEEEKDRGSSKVTMCRSGQASKIKGFEGLQPADTLAERPHALLDASAEKTDF